MTSPLVARLGRTFILSVAGWCLALGQADGQFELQEQEDAVRVVWQGELITEYRTAAPSPILWPLLGPGGVKLTRDFPMIADTEGEKRDHPHHRSMWFTHGAVNGADFWHKGGKVLHQEFTRLEGGAQAVIGATNLWVKDQGEQVLVERRLMMFGANQAQRWIDFDIALVAEFGDVHFGDTKEGTFAVRVAETMKVDAAKGGKILNSEGRLNFATWGQRAAWVNYTGPVGEGTYGIAMFCHPSSFNYPNRWHVRTYGLFAANPFGEKDFPGGDKDSDGVRLTQGQQLKFRYRILLHAGIDDSDQIGGLFDEYARINYDQL